MKFSSLWLVLLVVLTPLDDLAALATADTDDDVLATRNNEFLPEAAGQAQTLQRQVAPLPPGHQGKDAVAVAALCARDRQAGTRPWTLSELKLRYVLMSLLR
jgi:hypothetical protein